MTYLVVLQTAGVSANMSVAFGESLVTDCGTGKEIAKIACPLAGAVGVLSPVIV